MLVKLIQNDLWLGASFELDKNAHAIAIGFVAHVGDVVDDFVIHQLGDALDQCGFVDLIGNLGHDDPLPSLRQVLDCRLGAYGEAAAAIGIGLLDSAAAIDEAASGEIRAFDDLEKLFERGLRILHQSDRRIHDLSQVVRRNVGRHADGDSVRSIDQKIGNAGGKHRWLSCGLVIIRYEIDSVFVDIGEHLARDFIQAALGVSHRRRRISIHRSEVPLAVNQRIPQGKILGHSHQCVVDRAVAMRMVLAHRLADDLCAFGVLLVVLQAHLIHRVKHTTMHGLESIADIRKRAPNDHRHGVVEI